MEYCKVYEDDDRTIVYYIMGMWEDEQTGEHVEMRVEKEEDMDVYAEFTLPAYYCHHAYGFKETELMEIKKFLKNNAVLIWDMAREAG